MGPLHLCANLFYLWLFGEAVERAIGSIRFGLVFVGAALAAGWLHAAAVPGSFLPAVGASGAISGLLGYAMVTQPHMRIVFFIIPMPIWLAIVLLVIVHALAITLGWGQGIAWWGHLGGLVAGMILAFFVRPRVNPEWEE